MSGRKYTNVTNILFSYLKYEKIKTIFPEAKCYQYKSTSEFVTRIMAFGNKNIFKTFEKVTNLKRKGKNTHQCIYSFKCIIFYFITEIHKLLFNMYLFSLYEYFPCI